MKSFVKIAFLSLSTIGSFAQNLQCQISAISDDAEEIVENGKINLNSSDLELTQDKKEQIVGLRFQNINIPKGALINRAYIQFTVDEKNTRSTNLVIYGEQNPNPSTFKYANKNISSRTKTSAFVNWVVPKWEIIKEKGIEQQSSDISSIVQEIVNQNGWSSGNSMAFMISGSGKRVAKAYRGVNSNAPILYIDYTTQSTQESNNSNQNSENSDGYIIKKYISSISDDAEEYIDSGDVNLYSSDLELVQEHKKQIVGLRFNNIPIPKNSHIKKSYIQFTTDESSSEPTTLTIYAQKIANAPTYLSEYKNISSRKKTDTSLKWSPKAWNRIDEKGINQKSVDLSPIVQEIVNQDQWSIDNSIAFIISGDGKRVANSYSSKKEELSPMLYIEYDDISTSDITPKEEDNKSTITVSSSDELEKALNSALDNTTIILNPGNYTLENNIVISQNNLTIASRYILTNDENDINSTIINGRGDYENRILDSNPSPNLGSNLKIIGLTVKNGGKFVTFTKGNDNLVSHCNISQIQRDIVSFDNRAGGKVLYCNLINSGDDAIDVDTKNDGNFEFAYNKILNSGDDGIEIHLYHHIGYESSMMRYNIHNNIFKNSSCDAIQLIDYDEKTNREFYIYNNSFIKNGHVAIGAIYKKSTHKKFIGTNMLEFAKIYNNIFTEGKYHILGGDNMYIENNQFNKASVTALKRVKGNSVIINNIFNQNRKDFDDCNN